MSQPRPLRERFWEKVQKSEGCWTWTSAVDASGYGQISAINRRKEAAHRVSWELHNGPIPSGLCVLHRCDNPSCVRPDHLFLGTKKDNSLDCVTKGRHPFVSQTHCRNGHPYPANMEYEARPDRDKPAKFCRVCRSNRVQAQIAKRKIEGRPKKEQV